MSEVSHPPVSFFDRYQGDQYLQATGDWHDSSALWKAERVLQMINEGGLAPGTVADIGCGTGGVLAHLQKVLPPHLDFIGFEVAAPAFNIAKTRTNDRLHFVNDKATGRFDLALCLDVFEHVPDYLGFLREIRPLAAAFIFHIPLDLSMRCIWHDTPMARRFEVGHLHYFTATTAKATLEDCGFRIEHAFHTHAAMEPWPASKWTVLKRYPDRWLFKRNPDLCAKILGGCSLMVLASDARSAETTAAPAGANVVGT